MFEYCYDNIIDSNSKKVEKIKKKFKITTYLHFFGCFMSFYN